MGDAGTLADRYRIMKIKIKTFATIRETFGFDEKELIVSDGISVKEIVRDLEMTYPTLKNIAGLLLYAVNEEYCPVDTLLADGDILAIFPPVSGG